MLLSLSLQKALFMAWQELTTSLRQLTPPFISRRLTEPTQQAFRLSFADRSEGSTCILHVTLVKKGASRPRPLCFLALPRPEGVAESPTPVCQALEFQCEKFKALSFSPAAAEARRLFTSLVSFLSSHMGTTRVRHFASEPIAQLSFLVAYGGVSQRHELLLVVRSLIPRLHLNSVSRCAPREQIRSCPPAGGTHHLSVASAKHYLKLPALGTRS